MPCVLSVFSASFSIPGKFSYYLDFYSPSLPSLCHIFFHSASNSRGFNSHNYKSEIQVFFSKQEGLVPGLPEGTKVHSCSSPSCKMVWNWHIMQAHPLMYIISLFWGSGIQPRASSILSTHRYTPSLLPFFLFLF
jgi:hypothetical protein